nr:MAG TPA: Helix-turn-helix XRE-family like protein [Caudoviricetes sp.]
MMVNIRDKRKSKGISQKEFASQLNVDQTAVSMWETGKSMPKADKLPAIAKLLDCSIEEILEG